MKVKITHDGSMDCAMGGTVILNAETGDPIERVGRIEIVLDANNGPEAILFVSSVQLDATIDARVEREQALSYDPDDNDSLDKAIALLQARRAERDA